MESPRPSRWARHRHQDRPAATRASRRGIVLVGTGILTALMLFILAIFASFGRPTIGLAVASGLFGPWLAWIWWDYRRAG